MDRPVVLWVTTEASADPRGGGALRSHRLITELARTTAVHVVSLGAPLQVHDYVRATGVASAHAFRPDFHSSLRVLTARLTGTPAAVTRLTSSEARAFAKEARAAADVVVIESLSLAQYAGDHPCVVAALHNVDSEMIRSWSPPRLWPKRVGQRLEVHLTRLGERQAVRDPRVLPVVVSDHDRALLGGGEVVPNGCDLPEAVPPLPAQPRILFVGNLGYGPNLDAVRWWHREIRPLLQRPHELDVVGRGDARDLDELKTRPGLIVHGEVSAVAPYLQAARVVVVPLRSGSGTRLKILEALAWGRPVVTTTKGAEGLPVSAGRHLLVADTPTEFAAGVERLLEDDELSTRLSAEGRALAERLDWPSLARAFAALVHRHAVISGRRQGP